MYSHTFYCTYIFNELELKTVTYNGIFNILNKQV